MPRAPSSPTPSARYIVAWETALRPRTIGKLTAPTDYHRGATSLHIGDEIDKNRFGRPPGRQGGRHRRLPG